MTEYITLLKWLQQYTYKTLNQYVRFKLSNVNDVNR